MNPPQVYIFNRTEQAVRKAWETFDVHVPDYFKKKN